MHMFCCVGEHLHDCINVYAVVGSPSFHKFINGYHSTDLTLTERSSLTHKVSEIN